MWTHCDSTRSLARLSLFRRMCSETMLSGNAPWWQVGGSPNENAGASSCRAVAQAHSSSMLREIMLCGAHKTVQVEV